MEAVTLVATQTRVEAGLVSEPIGYINVIELSPTTHPRVSYYPAPVVSNCVTECVVSNNVARCVALFSRLWESM